MTNKIKWTVYSFAGLYVLVSVVFFTFTIDGSQQSLPFVESEAKEVLQSTSTVEFDLSGIDNQQKLEDRIEVLIAETRATQQKQEAEQKLEELKKKETALE